MAEIDDVEVRARSFWSGTITFGLVSIPVELFPANRSDRVSLRMVSPNGVPLSRRYFCPKDNRELDWDELVRGYEIEKDEFVVVSDDELERLAPEKTRDIDLRRFVAASEIDPIYFERAYYLTPGGNSTKAYRLLAKTMEQTDRAGIATFVMRGKEYLIAILAENGILRAETLRFVEEVRTPDDVGLPEPAKPDAAVVKQIEKAIEKLVEAELDEDELVDRSAERLLKLVAKKERSGEDVVEAPEGEAEPSEGIIDLMEVLKRSLAGGDGAKSAKKATSGGRSTSGTKSSSERATAKAGARSTSKTKGTTKANSRTVGKTASGRAKKAAGKKTTRAAKTTVRKPAKTASRKPAKTASRKPAKKVAKKPAKKAAARKSA